MILINKGGIALILFIIKIIAAIFFAITGVCLAYITSRYKCDDSHDIMSKMILYLIALLYIIIAIRFIF